MISATLQLKYYFVAELSVIANRDHDRTKPIALTDENLVVVPTFIPDTKDSRLWQVTLRVQQQAGPAANAPYFFTAMDTWCKAHAGTGAGQVIYCNWFNYTGYANGYYFFTGTGAASGQTNFAAAFRAATI